MAYSGSGNSTDSPQDALRQPMRVVVDPTDLSAAFPYGGTSLGLTAGGGEIRIAPRVTPLRCWTEQADTYAYLTIGWRSFEARVSLSEWNPDTLQALFPASTAAGSFGRLATFPGSLTPTVGTSEYVSVLFAPRDEGYGQFVYLRSVLMTIDDEPLAFGRQTRTTLPVKFLTRRDTSATATQQIAVIGSLEDLQGVTL